MANQDRDMDRKAVFEPYDMDTAIGTNNSGILMFTPYLEDTDTVSSVMAGGDGTGSNAPVYNAQDSVLWNNIRDAFRDELRAMYRSLRTSTNTQWTYQAIEKRFEDHQAKWPEAIFNEDAWVKYIIPLVDPVTYDEETGQYIRTDRYLTMLQGSKQEQRKWWLYNRFRYLDSKYHTGNAVSNSIDIRLFNDGTLRLKAAVPLYLSVSFGLGTTPIMQRTDAGTVASFQYVAPTGVTEMETSIWSGNLITDVGDLSVFYPNECNFSKAVLLRRLKIGDLSSNYSNANLKVLDVRNCPLLEYINCANSPQLATTINLENSSRLVEAYFEGTSISGVDLADGCVIETLHLPATITALTLLNLSKLSDLQVASYANITRLMLANINQNALDLVDVLETIRTGSQINIQGLYMEFNDADAISDFFNLLDTMTGVTRERQYINGEWQWIYHDEDRAVVNGEVHTAYLTGEQIDELSSRYPYVRATADHTTTTLKYYTWDGSTLLHSETIVDGGNGTYSGSPARATDAQYIYTFAGWSKNQNGSPDPTATQDVSTNRSVYASYNTQVRTYTVTWKNIDDTVLETDTNVPYGTTPSYDGDTPSHDEQTATGWTPPVGPITGDTIYTAAYLPVYSINFVRDENDGGGTLYTTSVLEGSVPVYSGETPTSVQGNPPDVVFDGWSPALAPVYEDTTYTARFLDTRNIVIQFLARTLREYNDGET